MKGKLTARSSVNVSICALALLAALASAVMPEPASAGSYGMTPGDLREVGGEPTWQWRPESQRGVQLGLESHPSSFTTTDVRFRPRSDSTTRALDSRVYGQGTYEAGYQGAEGMGHNPYSGFMANRFQSSLTGSQGSIRSAARSNSMEALMGRSVLAPVSGYGGTYRYETPYQSMTNMYGSSYSSIGGGSIYGVAGSHE